MSKFNSSNFVRSLLQARSESTGIAVDSSICDLSAVRQRHCSPTYALALECRQRASVNLRCTPVCVQQRLMNLSHSSFSGSFICRTGIFIPAIWSLVPGPVVSVHLNGHQSPTGITAMMLDFLIVDNNNHLL